MRENTVETSMVQCIKPFYVMEVLEKAAAMEKAGEHIVHLQIGEPDFDTPEPITKAIKSALDAGKTSYTHSLGEPELREAICELHEQKYGASVHPDQVAVTNGVSPAMILAFSALLEPGDEVILPNPHYPCYPSFIQLAGGKVVYAPAYEEDGFQFRVSAVKERITERTRAIMLNSPSNPTGTLLSKERFAALAELGPALVSDEIYNGLVYAGEEHSVAEFTDQGFVLNGFSKLYAMTGLRLGYLISPRQYVCGVQKLAQNLFICANAAVQWGGVAALRECGEHAEHMRRIYDERRRYLLERLAKMGLSVAVEPTGAFYVFANAKHLAERFEGDSLQLSFDILEKAKVGVTPGSDFGSGGEGFLRFSYANSMENIAEGLDRLEKYVAAEH